jgi:hypothetical protein
MKNKDDNSKSFWLKLKETVSFRKKKDSEEEIKKKSSEEIILSPKDSQEIIKEVEKEILSTNNIPKINIDNSLKFMHGCSHEIQKFDDLIFCNIEPIDFNEF